MTALCARKYLKDVAQVKDTELFNYNRNHVGMTSIAIDTIAARFPDTGMERLAEHYQAVIVAELDQRPLPSFGGAQDVDAVVTADNMASCIGKGSHATAFARFFKGEVQNMGSASEEDKVRRLMTTYFTPHVQQSIHAGAFHALLRISFGIDFVDAGEVAMGLAYLYSGFKPVPPTPESSPTEDLAASLRALLDSDVCDRIDLTGILSIQSRQEQFFVDDGFRKVLPPSIQTSDSFEDVLREAMTHSVAYFEREHDFSILHCISGCNAMHAVLPYLHPTGMDAFRAGALATIAAVEATKRRGDPVVAAEGVSLVQEGESEPASWKALSHAMVGRLLERRANNTMSTSGFEHTIKLMYALMQVSARQPTFEERALLLMKRELVQPSPYR